MEKTPAPDWPSESQGSRSNSALWPRASTSLFCQMWERDIQDALKLTHWTAPELPKVSPSYPPSCNVLSQEASGKPYSRAAGQGRLLLLLKGPIIPAVRQKGPQRLSSQGATQPLQTPLQLGSPHWLLTQDFHPQTPFRGFLEAFCLGAKKRAASFSTQCPKGKWHSPRIWTNFFRRRNCENCTDPCYLKHLRSKLQEVVDWDIKDIICCLIISFFSGADRTAVCYYRAHQEMLSCQTEKNEWGISSPVHATQTESLHLVVMQLHLSSS